MDYLISVILGILANLLTPAAQRALSWPVSLVERERSMVAVSPGGALASPEMRAVNRRRLERKLWIASLYVTCFVVLFGAFWLPVVLKSLPGGTLGFTATRLAFVGVYHVQSPFALCLGAAATLYLPMMVTSERLAGQLVNLLTNYYELEGRRYAALVSLTFLFLTVLLAGHVAYALFPGLSYLSCVLFPFALFAMLIQTNGKR
jgi:hypothetical protein